MIDIKEKIDEIVKKISGDNSLAKKFLKNPVKTVEDLIGKDLPDEKVKEVVKGVKEKINPEKIKALLDSDGDGKPDLGILSKVFGKK